MREYRPGSYQMLPPIIKNLIIINVLVFLAQTLLPPSVGIWIENTFALHSWQSPLFKPWQPLTHLFMHGSFAHIFGNMFALWMFGSVLENLWGAKRFLYFYLICGLGAAFFHLLYLYFQMGNMVHDFAALKANFNVNTFIDFANKYGLGRDNRIVMLANTWQANPDNHEIASAAINFCTQYYNQALNEATIGASGAVFGVLVAFGYLFPNTYLYFYFLFPIKAKWFVIGYILIELFLTIQNSAGDNVAHVAHLGGGLIGFVLVYYWNRHNRQNFY